MSNERRLDLYRLHCEWGATIGALYLDGVYQCFTLEDPAHEAKIPGRTRIPAGEYRAILRTEGRMYQRYLERFGRESHQGMVWLQDVPEFTYIYFHIGNVVGDTEGCILVGTTAMRDQVLSSTAAYRRLYPRLVDAARDGRLIVRILERQNYE